MDWQLRMWKINCDVTLEREVLYNIVCQQDHFNVRIGQCETAPIMHPKWPLSHPSTYFRHHYRPYHVISVTSVPCLPLKIVCDCWGMKHGACTRCVWKSWKFCFYPWNNCTSQNCMFYVSFQSSKYCNSNHCLHINLREIIHIHTNCIYSENDGSIMMAVSNE